MNLRPLSKSKTNIKWFLVIAEIKRERRLRISAEATNNVLRFMPITNNDQKKIAQNAGNFLKRENFTCFCKFFMSIGYNSIKKTIFGLLIKSN